MLKVTTKVSLTTKIFIQTNKLRTLLSGEMLRIAKKKIFWDVEIDYRG